MAYQRPAAHSEGVLRCAVCVQYPLIFWQLRLGHKFLGFLVEPFEARGLGTHGLDSVARLRCVGQIIVYFVELARRFVDSGIDLLVQILSPCGGRRSLVAGHWAHAGWRV